VCVFPGLAQEKVDPNIERYRFSGTREGFSVKDFTKIGSAVKPGNDVTIDGRRVQISSHIVKKQFFVSTELCSGIGNDIRVETPLEDPGLFFRVKSIDSYHIRSQTFAYEVSYEFFDAESGAQVGATTLAYYVDNDGKGKFYLECVKDFELNRIPDWVKL